MPFGVPDQAEARIHAQDHRPPLCNSPGREVPTSRKVPARCRQFDAAEPLPAVETVPIAESVRCETGDLCQWDGLPLLDNRRVGARRNAYVVGQSAAHHFTFPRTINNAMIANPLIISVGQERLSNGYGQLTENVEQKSRSEERRVGKEGRSRW